MSESDRPSRPSRSQDGRGRHARPDERTPRRIREAPGETPSAGSTRLPRSSRRNGTDADTGRGGTDDRGTRRSDARGAGRGAGTASSRRAATARGRKDRSTGPHDHRQLGPVPVKVVLSLLAVVLLVGGGYAYSAVGRLAGSLSTTSGLNLGNEADGATDILLVGADSRTDAKGNPLTQKQIDMLRAGEETTTNTDTMILIRIPNDGSSATAVSLPRDTYVDAGEYGNLKLNAVYANYKVGKEDELAEEAAATGETPDEKTVEQESTQAGREGLIRSIADLTGISVDHYAEVGLLGFVLLTDAVGGVDVCLKNAVDEPLSGAKFPAGRQTLDGPDALSFVRQRHELPRGDLDRITRQQAYLASLANKILSAKTLSDPGRLSKLNDAVSRSLTIDSGWDIMGLATQMQGLSGGNVTFQTIPVTSIDGTGDNGESVVTVDRSQVHSFFDDLLGDEDKETSTAAETSDADIPDYDAAKSTVSVFNGGDTAGLASRVGDLVADAGFGVGEVGNSTDSGVSESQVNVADTSDPAARDLAEKLGGLKVVEDPDLGAGEITVTLSGTYDGPGSTADDTRTLSGSGEAEPDSSDGADGSTDSSGDVGTPGTMEDGGPEDRKAIDAGGLMCVN